MKLALDCILKLGNAPPEHTLFNSENIRAYYTDEAYPAFVLALNGVSFGLGNDYDGEKTWSNAWVTFMGFIKIVLFLQPKILKRLINLQKMSTLDINEEARRAIQSDPDGFIAAWKEITGK